MPFFNHSMAQSMRKISPYSTGPSPDKVGERVLNQRLIRSMPGITANGRTIITRETDPTIVAKYTQKMSLRKLMFTRSLLKSQIEQLNNQNTSISTESSPGLFDSYQIEKTQKIYERNGLEMYFARSKTSPEFSMMACIYAKNQLPSNNQFYLKILRHLGRKHPYIVNIWEIFHTNDTIIIFQEYVSQGNLLTYLENNEIEERQVCFWAKQIFRALDFLGDNGIVHRDITPTHLLIKPMGNEVWVKLTGFKRSMIYWNIDENDVNLCECLPIEQQKIDGPNFQAPEVYGNAGECFDPIIADIWSYGANLFFCLAKYYPFNVEQPHSDLDEEIWQNIRSETKLSMECQNFLFGLLRANANDRIPFDFIDHDEWIRKSYRLALHDIVRGPCKHLEKVKINQKVVA